MNNINNELEFLVSYICKNIYKKIAFNNTNKSKHNPKIVTTSMGLKKQKYFIYFFQQTEENLCCINKEKTLSSWPCDHYCDYDCPKKTTYSNK